MADKQWFSITLKGVDKVVYIISADNSEQVKEYFKDSHCFQNLKCLTWVDLRDLAGILVPCNENRNHLAVGNITINYEGRLVIIWPI